jgi:ABC-type multidrug transport system ATPase subunit
LAGLVHTDKSDQEQQDLVEDIMSKLGLAHAAEQIVGSPSGIRGESRGISGGERKRLGVAEAMINSPKLIFLDEYTRCARCAPHSAASFRLCSDTSTEFVFFASASLHSGLDSESALALTKLLRNLAEQGHTIVATVHQPSSAIFFMFDTLCLLAQGR